MSQPRPLQFAAVGLLLLGTLVRIVGFLQNASLSGDEAMLALSIGTRSFRGLLKPLDYGQVATVPFLWAERLITSVAGLSGYTLRIVTLFSGIALLWIVFRLSRDLLGFVVALVTLALVATSFPLIRYSVEIKPYILDSSIAAALVWISLGVFTHMEDRRRWLWLAVTGAVGVLVSAPALLVGTAVMLGLAIVSIRTRQWRLLFRSALLAVLWGTVFGVAYARWYAPNAEAPYMRAFWAEAFLTPGSPGLLQHLWRSLGDLSCTLTCWRGLLDVWPILLLLGLVGSIHLIHRRGLEYGVLVAGPILGAFAASAIGKYPIATRLVLFSAPLLAILVAAGAVAVAETIERSWPRVRSRWLLLFLLYPSLALAAMLAFAPPADWGFHGVEVRPLAELYRKLGRDEPIWIFPRAAPAWAFHSTDWNAPDTTRLKWFAKMAGPSGPGFVNGASRGPRHACDGAALVYAERGARELLGTSTGAQGRVGVGYTPPKPDSGWAESEVLRMHAVAKPFIWIVMSDFAHGPLDERQILMRAVQDQGGAIVYSRETADAALYRVRFVTPQRLVCSSRSEEQSSEIVNAKPSLPNERHRSPEG